MEETRTALYSLVEELCTAKQVHALLKRFEDRPSVKLTAENRSALIKKNLRDAVDAKSIPLQDVYELVRESEENGRQHIFYYQPASKDVRNIPFETVGARLFGREWKAKTASPVFALEENKFNFSDFRQWNAARKPLDWCLKIYGLQFIEEEQKSQEEKIDERTVKRTFVSRPVRLVLFVRWNSPDLLEIRIPQSSSRKKVKEWLDQAWSMLAPAFRSDEFRAWNLDSARRSLILGQSKSAKRYRFSHSTVEDAEHNHIAISAAHTERSLDANTPICKSLQAMTKEGVGECRFLRITWLKGAEGETPASDLVSYLGEAAENDVSIGRQCSAGEIDFVTDQLREFSKPAPAA